MDGLFDERLVRPSTLFHAFVSDTAHPIDMYQTDSDVVVKATLPGLKPEEVDVTISGDVLTIKGETKADEEIKREDYFYQQHRYGEFSRSLRLPGELRADEAVATFEDGILTLTVPKAEEIKPKQIKVKSSKAIGGRKETKGKKA